MMWSESLSCVWLFAASSTIQSIEFSRLEYRNGRLSLYQGIFSTQGSNQVSHFAGRLFTSWVTRIAQEYWMGSISLLQQIFPIQDSNWGFLYCRSIIHHWGIGEAWRLYDKHENMYFLRISCSVQFSHSVVSDFLRPHESQHTRPPCPSLTPGVYPNSCPSSRWCHPAISSSVVPFSSYPQFLPISGC